MSLVTKCPSCGTSFRITPEQLSAHRGDVRCGHCQHIFSALKQLEEVIPAPPQEPAPQEQLPSEDQHETPVVEAAEESSQVEVEVEPIDNSPSPETSEEELPEVDELHVNVETLGLNIELADEPLQEAIEEEIAFTEEIEISAPLSWADDITPPEHAVAEPTREAPEPAIVATAIPAETPAEPALPAGTDHSEKNSKRRVPTWLLALIAFLLVLTALGQTVYFLRNGIASRFPQTSPVLSSFCQPFHCNIELPRQADLLSIEDSDLKDDPEHEGVVVLVSMLDNRAPFTQAFPQLELTLTDTFDQPLLRRTFAPQEYLPTGISAAQGIAASGQVHIRLNLSISGVKPAGYRLYVKY